MHIWHFSSAGRKGPLGRECWATLPNAGRQRPALGGNAQCRAPAPCTAPRGQNPVCKCEKTWLTPAPPALDAFTLADSKWIYTGFKVSPHIVTIKRIVDNDRLFINTIYNHWIKIAPGFTNWWWFMWDFYLI